MNVLISITFYSINVFFSSAESKNSLKSNHGSGSGGFTENLFIAAAKELFGKDLVGSDLEYKTLKNADFQEITLEHEGEVKLTFAVANGFRNIQNLVQKMKRKRCQYDFVEVMACPSGCLNGGAQCRPDEGKRNFAMATCYKPLTKVNKSCFDRNKNAINCSEAK